MEGRRISGSQVSIASHIQDCRIRCCCKIRNVKQRRRRWFVVDDDVEYEGRNTHGEDPITLDALWINIDSDQVKSIRNGIVVDHKECMVSLQRMIKAQQLVALMNLRFKGRFKSELVCVAKASWILLTFPRYKFEDKLQRRMVQVEFLQLWNKTGLQCDETGVVLLEHHMTFSSYKWTSRLIGRKHRDYQARKFDQILSPGRCRKLCRFWSSVEAQRIIF
ncbi:hypothetical protein YC2023_121469 [Brassica napus]